MNRFLKNAYVIILTIVFVCIFSILIVKYGMFDSDYILKNEETSKTLTTIEKLNELKTLLDESFGKETKEEEQIEETEETVEDESDEEYLKPGEDFKPVETREKIDRFCFVGDMYMSKHPRNAYDKKGISGIVDAGYLNILKKSDLNVANLECSITDVKDNEADKTFTFALPSKYVKAFKEIGINLFTLANNHILDYGEDAMINTIKVLDENKISHIGAGKNIKEAKRIHIEEISGKRYGFISASSVLPYENWKAGDDSAGVLDGYNIKTVCAEIKKAKPYLDKIIVYMHWGKELDLVSTTWQKEYARRLVDSGADLVVGAHSHTVQEIEYYKGVPIVYSMGNFIYGGTMRDTMLVEATFNYNMDKNGMLQLTVYPGVSNYEKVVRTWNKETLLERYKELQDKSSTVYIGDNGIVFTMAQVEEGLKALAEKEGKK